MNEVLRGMTLEAMTRAMAEELQRQADAEEYDAPYFDDMQGGPKVIIDGMVDLRALALAALKSLRDPNLEIIAAGASADEIIENIWPRMIDYLTWERP